MIMGLEKTCQLAPKETLNIKCSEILIPLVVIIR